MPRFFLPLRWPWDAAPEPPRSDDFDGKLIILASERRSGKVPQVDETPTYDLAVPTSYAESFWSSVTASAGEYGYTVL
jgi:hypothetical protein